MNNIIKCEECKSLFYEKASKISSLCPECAYYIYNYENCNHIFEKLSDNQFKTSYGVSTPQEEVSGGRAPVPPETPEQNSEVFSNKNKIRCKKCYWDKSTSNYINSLK
ncbi:MAG: hypothetical protein U0457_10085 [Candidatus Sericytochromatia bacterium]